MDVDDLWEHIEVILDNTSSRLIFRLEWLIY